MTSGVKERHPAAAKSGQLTVKRGCSNAASPSAR
jgi:hypothetical protein